MKNKLKPLITGLIMILPLLLLSFATPQKVSAADSVKVTLHNRVFDSAREAKQNTGEIMNDFGGTGLNGVTFKAYNVTDHYLSLRKSGYSAQHDMTPEIRTLISGVIFMTKYTKEIKLAIYHEWVDDHRRGTYL
ncbi:pilin N-terminal domain-containing protein, partial [Lactobacillus delbrueckii]|uniref:pilin N-terminal domain-containing protein n=1 Tax=Lactobacillus delbrueckii TaxID=1584 RepID=UPI0022AFE091